MSDQNVKLELPIQEDVLLALAKTLAGQGAAAFYRSGQLIELSARDCMALAGYMMIVSHYGREFIVEALGLSERSERRWAALARDAAEAYGDGTDPESLRVMQEAAAAVQRRKPGTN